VYGNEVLEASRAAVSRAPSRFNWLAARLIGEPDELITPQVRARAGAGLMPSTAAGSPVGPAGAGLMPSTAAVTLLAKVQRA